MAPASGNITDKYVFFDGGRLARIDASGNADYYLSDKLESAAVVTDASGNVLDDCDYLPYGQTSCPTSSSGNHYLYTGLERDADQLDHTLHRQYSSNYGRWMSPDPGGVKVVNLDTPQTWNMYAYVTDNPTSLNDPLGLLQNTPVGCTVNVYGVGFNCSGPGDGDISALPISFLNNTIPAPALNADGSLPFLIREEVLASASLPSYWQVVKSFNNCAANFAEKHSVASMLHVNNVPILGTLFGSSTAAASHLLFGTNPGEYVPAGTNLAAGAKAGAITLGTATELSKIPIDQGFQSVFTTISPTNFGETVEGAYILKGAERISSYLDWAVKPLFLWDEAAYAYGEAACTAQAF